MKKLFLILLTSFLFQIIVEAQEKERNGYIGIGTGVSYLFGYEKEFGKNVGTSFQLINFGFEIGKGFGVSALLASGVHQYDSELIPLDNIGSPISIKNEIGYSASMVGPMYSMDVFKTWILDIKVRGGRFYVREKISGENLNITSTKLSVQYSLGISLRKNFAKRWCLTFSTDYFTGKSANMISKADRVNAISSGVGIGFRL